MEIGDSMQEKDNERFSFINEKRKEKPINKKKLFFCAFFVVLMAVVFGVVASFVFVYCRLQLEEKLMPPETNVVTIPKDYAEETEETEQVLEPEEETEAAGENQSTEELAGENDTQSAETGESQSAAGGQQAESAAKEISIADFQKLQNQLYDVGKEANSFIVTVTGVKSDTDWFYNDYESKGQASGIILADNGEELLILTERKNIADAEKIYVTFYNEATAEASMKKYDGNTGVAVLSVPLEKISEETMEMISFAVLGNSLITKQGELVIAVGNPLGTNYSILTGNITSTTNSITTIDNKYSIFTTDIVGNKNGSGVLLNLEGEVIGLVMQGYNSGEEGILTAVSISELKTMIERLSNGADIPYAGLELTTVTNDIAVEYDIPKGAYIKDVRMDSPAMAAGLQRGDVIISMDGDVIFTVEGYENKLMSMSPGDIVTVVVKRQSPEGYTDITCTMEIGVLQ